MNCFYHLGTVAVGICKSCGKGLCHECAADMGKGLACRGHCEGEVAAVSDLISSNIKRSAINREIVDSARRNRYMGAAFYLGFAGLLFAFVFYKLAYDSLSSPEYLFVGMGVLFLIFGLVALSNARRLSK